MKFSNGFLFVFCLTCVPADAASVERSRHLSIAFNAQPSSDGQFSENGRFYATKSIIYDGSGHQYAHNVQSVLLQVWDARTGATFARWKLRSLQDFALSPDGRTVAIEMGTDGYLSGVQIRHTRSGQLKHTLFRRGVISAAVHSLAWSNDGRFVATGSGDGLARIWDATNGRRVATLLVGGYVGALAFSPNGQTLAAVGDKSSGWVALYNWRRKQSLGGTRFHTYSIYATLRFAPDSKRLAVGDESEGETVLYSVPKLERMRRIPPPNGVYGVSYLPAPKLAFSWDGSKVAYVARNFLVVKDAMFGRVFLRRPIKRTGWGNGIGDYIVAVQFSPNNRLYWATVRRSLDASGNPYWSTPKIWSIGLTSEKLNRLSKSSH